MMVERSKLERVMGEAGKRATRSNRWLENCDNDDEGASVKNIDDAGQPEEITLGEDFLGKKVKVDLKRKAAEGDFWSRRLRRRG